MAQQINTRNIVVDILLEVTREGTFSHIIIRDVLEKYRYLPRRDRAFIKRLSEGTIERMIEMNYILDQFSKTKVNKMKPVMRAIMQSAVYQLLYMDAVPDSAVCNEAVKLASRRGFSGLKGFVNGVLRAIARSKEQIRMPSMEKEPVKALSVRYSMPEWITQMFLQQYGQERTEGILAAFLQKEDTCIRVDVSRCDPETVIASLREQGIHVVQDGRLPYALHISGYDTLEDIPEFVRGILMVQDVSSMMVTHLSGVKPHDFVLDVCAAPGGKSIHMAETLAGTGMVEARDLTEYKTDMIRENIERCGVSNMRAVCRDALVFDPGMENQADIVIADLPCSGLGVTGKKTDIKYHASPEKIGELAALQRQILAVVHRYVKPGGVLMYSTCTMTRQENQENTEWFLKEHPEFQMEIQKEFLPDEACDGFYIARWRRHPDQSRD